MEHGCGADGKAVLNVDILCASIGKYVVLINVLYQTGQIKYITVFKKMYFPSLFAKIAAILRPFLEQ